MSITRTVRSITLALLATIWAGGAPAQEGPDFKEIMQELGKGMDQLNAAIFAEDFAAMERYAAAIAHHPRPSPEERQRLMEAVGPDAELFRSIDHSVHSGAEGMADAARKGDMDGVLRFHGEVMQGCVSCHESFRARLAQPDSGQR